MSGGWGEIEGIGFTTVLKPITMQNEIEQQIYSIIKARTSFTDSFSLDLTIEIAAAIAPLVEAGEPDWKDAPEWANYLAMDANGYWWWYEEKPQLSRGIWAFGGERLRKTLHKQDVAWYESLQERPK